MGFLEAYKSFWKNYVNFSGRSSRSAYWYVVLWNAIIISIFYILILVFTVFTAATSSVSDATGDFAFIMTSGSTLLILLLLFLYELATFIPLLALTIRRLHDSNKSGWFVLLSLIPFVGSIIMIVFMCMPSEPSFSDDFDF
ncbi:hypothetical protein BMT55_11260 [Listeria newyorkensis]|uniref:DUF805 domain-containing protein n=1 Tax=Listeria newyorkensis TaxID=1497681 RepID=A0ABX4XLZ5_9LIST|nr:MULTISPECIES: DUF805 domain-containing protein [Listeria]KGL44368.1 membrane protein [Listeriaceae bacterium FSL A5-0209]KGL42496.1 membrane protein [Listeria newyorkensis]KMT60311.1 hypothetical protein X559_2616 [Listeria newyorkensis]PNP90962.1 hypothetical protein BMT55_11260 [Listeria newyorkensis]RQW65390.1 DUF805 domain-containing protein [Listeria sp. SHR_NRA_18]